MVSGCLTFPTSLLSLKLLNRAFQKEFFFATEEQISKSYIQICSFRDVRELCMRCKSDLLITSVKDDEHGGEQNITEDVDPLSHVRLDTSKAVCAQYTLLVARYLKAIYINK